MKVISPLVCRIVGNHKYNYFTDRCVRCGKVRSSAKPNTEETAAAQEK